MADSPNVITLLNGEKYVSLTYLRNTRATKTQIIETARVERPAPVYVPIFTQRDINPRGAGGEL